MFLTTPDAEKPLPAGLAPPGVRTWAYFVQRLALQWFHVTMRVGSSTTCIFAMHYRQWLDIHEAAIAKNKLRSQPRLLSVQLVSPDWLNGSSGWQMEHLQELWLGTDPEQDLEVCVFVVASGARYMEPKPLCSESALTNRRKIFDRVEIKSH